MTNIYLSDKCFKPTSKIFHLMTLKRRPALYCRRKSGTARGRSTNIHRLLPDFARRAGKTPRIKAGSSKPFQIYVCRWLFFTYFICFLRCENISLLSGRLVLYMVGGSWKPTTIRRWHPGLPTLSRRVSQLHTITNNWGEFIPSDYISIIKKFAKFLASSFSCTPSPFIKKV